MNENKSNPDVIQDEFTVCFEKKDGKYEVIAYTGSNKSDSRCLLRWAIVSAEMTNLIISDSLPANPEDFMKTFRAVVAKATTVVEL